MSETAETPSSIEILVGPGTDQRVDRYVADRLDGFSRSQLRKLIDQQRVYVNDTACRPNTLLSANDRVRVEPLVSAEPSPLQPVDLQLDVLYEDDHIIVINKPAGLVVHAGAGDTGPTLVQGLLYHCKTLSAGSSAERPGIVHRLDKDTSGALVCAKTLAAHQSLAQQFEAKTNLRRYVALLDGFMAEPSRTVESYLTRDPRNRVRSISVPGSEVLSRYPREGIPRHYRFARTHIQRLSTYQRRLSLASFQLDTGRTHQIRVHALALGLPVFGDSLYGGSDRLLPLTLSDESRLVLGSVRRQLLHAQHLGFEHPATGAKVAFEAPIPGDFREVVDALSKYMDIE